MNESPIFTAPCCTFFGRRAMLELSKVELSRLLPHRGTQHSAHPRGSEVYVSRDFPIS